MSLILDAIEFYQRKNRMFIATIPVSHLDHFSIDIWNPKNVSGRMGYQRQPDEKRIAGIAKYFERKSTIMPVAGLVNVREKNQITFRKGKLKIPDGANVWVVDMQHRLKGLVRAHERGIIPRTFRFPIVITEGLSQLDEAAQFYIINTKAKKMDVALTRRLLIENEQIKVLAEVKPWEIAAVRATIELNLKIRGNPWYGVIRQPNEEKQKRHVATEKSFVSSLRQIFIGGRNKNAKRAAKRLAFFWSVLRDIIPEAFVEPKRYLIQKTPGMFAFNFFIAPSMLAKHKDREFQKKLRGLRTISADFWKRSNKKGARRFGTGMGGYANLANHIQSYL